MENISSVRNRLEKTTLGREALPLLSAIVKDNCFREDAQSKTLMEHIRKWCSWLETIATLD
jgi:hypothetical protein